MKIGPVLILLAIFATVCRAADFPKTVTISAGKFDRVESIVTFPLAGDALNMIYELVADGETLRIQLLAGDRALVILPELKAGQSNTYTLRSYANTKEQPPNKNLVRDKNN